MEVVMCYLSAVKLVEEQGWDDFLSFISNQFPSLGLYKCSMDWFENPKYICKVKGVYGDILIYWQ